MCASRTPLGSHVDQQVGVALGHLLVVVEDGNHIEDVFEEGEATSAPPPGGEQHTHSQLGHRDRSYGDVIFILDRCVKAVSGSLRVDEIGRVEEKARQGRSSS